MKKPTEKMSIAIGTLSGLVTMAWKLGSVMAQPAANKDDVEDRPGDLRLGEELAEDRAAGRSRRRTAVVYSTGFMRASICFAERLGQDEPVAVEEVGDGVHEGQPGDDEPNDRRAPVLRAHMASAKARFITARST